MNKIFFFTSLLILNILFLLLLPVFTAEQFVFALKGDLSCANRYLTLVNPVRGRDLWIDNSLKPLKDQYGFISRNSFSATWLLQYDVLNDKELLQEFNNFDSNQEFGLFLEISPNYANQARVIYPSHVSWFSPKAVFLSGYSQSDRRKLIDELFKKFKSEFGYYPQSVGAWWIDSYSLGYIKDKYNIQAVLIVADQKITDNYGVWGQWWGVPFYPSKLNILIPASTLKNKEDLVVIQWAQRDLFLAYGDGLEYSNYSLQANDYIRQGKDITYFKELVGSYLDCQNFLGQVTVGLETGMESVEYIEEYANQLKALKQIDSLRSVTMSKFADRFKKAYPQLLNKNVLSNQFTEWIMTPFHRENKELNDFITYYPEISFSDYFIADKADFLDRRLNTKSSKTTMVFIPWFLFFGLGLGIFSYLRKMIKIWFISLLFALSAFGLIFKSNFQYGWWVYYGEVIPYLMAAQAILVVVSFLLIWALSKIKKINLWLIPLILGLDFLVKSLRFSFFSDRYYLGFTPDPLRFAGIVFTKPFQISFINQDFPFFISASWLSFKQLFFNNILLVITYPLFYVIIAVFISRYFSLLNQTIRKIVIIILLLLFIFHINAIIQSDPRYVVPIN